MKKKIKFIILFLNCLIITNKIIAQDSTQLRQQIVTLLYNEMRVDSANLPGFVIGVIDGDSTFKFSFGKADKSSARKPDAHTIFEIGGLTHAFTATLAHQLVKTGKLHLDKPINAYLPLNEQFTWGTKLTVRQLLTHTSRLPKLPDNLGDEEHDIEQPYADYSKEHLFLFLKNYSPDTNATNKYLFSHINYALLEYVIENIEKQSFTNIFENYFYPPLSKRTFLGENTDPKLVWAQGYNALGKNTSLVRYASFSGALGVKSCLNDLLVFMKMNLTNKSFSDMHTPEIKTFMDENTKVAKGWHVMRQNKKTSVVVQSGTTRGFSAVMMFVPRNQTGVIILANAKINMNRIALLILKMVNNNWKK